MSNPYGGPPFGPNPQQPYGPPSGPMPQQPYGPPSAQMPQAPYGGAPVPGAHPLGQLAHWGWRALGFLIDTSIVSAGYGVLILIGMLLGFLTLSIGGGDEGAAMVFSIISLVVGLVGYAALVALAIWNVAYRRGKTGQTLGQKLVNISTLSEETGQPIGFGNAFARHLCHILDGMACYIGFLFPLWDEKRQTFADKIMRTVVVRIEPQAPGMPPAMPGQPGAYPPPGMLGGGFPQQPGYGQPPQQ